MAKNSSTNRTTLWDDQDGTDASSSSEAARPQATVSRGAWRAPSAVLAGDRAANGAVTGSARCVVSAMPPVSVAGEDGDRPPIPRRTKFETARTPWWRPRSTFGRILLGIGAALLLAAFGAAAYVTRQFLVRDPHFRISGASSIQSTGLSEVNRADVLPVFGEDIGRNIFFVPLAERRQQLESIPWVQQATVMRFLPDRLSVSIVERTPVAFVRQGSQVELADADGVILNMPPAMMAQHHYSFPVVAGINANDSLPARRARMAVYLRFLAELDQHDRHLTEQISEIDVSDPEDLRATMPEQGSDILAHFGEDQFLRRLQIYQAHIAEWRGRYPRLIGVDLRYNGEVPLEMSTDRTDSTATAVETASAAPAPSDTPQASTKAAPEFKMGPAKPAASAASKPAPPQDQIAKAKSAPKISLVKTNAATRKAAEAKTKVEKLKAAKVRAAKAKTAPTNRPTHSAPAATRQGQ